MAGFGGFGIVEDLPAGELVAQGAGVQGEGGARSILALPTLKAPNNLSASGHASASRRADPPVMAAEPSAPLPGAARYSTQAASHTRIRERPTAPQSFLQGVPAEAANQEKAWGEGGSRRGG